MEKARERFGGKLKPAESGGASGVGSPFKELEDEMFKEEEGAKTPEKQEAKEEEKKSKSAKKRERKRKSSSTPIADRAADWVKTKTYEAMVNYLIKEKAKGYEDEAVARRKLQSSRGKGAIKSDFTTFVKSSEFDTVGAQTRSVTKARGEGGGGASRSLEAEFKSER